MFFQKSEKTHYTSERQRERNMCIKANVRRTKETVCICNYYVYGLFSFNFFFSSVFYVMLL